MFGQLVRKLRRRLFGATTVEVLLEAERQAALAAEQYANSEPQEGAADDSDWIRALTLEAPLMPVEDMRRYKRLRAVLTYLDGEATESDLDCLSPEERDRLEAIAIQVRWDKFLGRPKGVDVQPGRFYL